MTSSQGITSSDSVDYSTLSRTAEISELYIAIYEKRWDIRLRLILASNRKLRTDFRLVINLMILNAAHYHVFRCRG